MLAAVECANEGIDLDIQTLICRRCGREVTMTTTHDHLSPHSPPRHIKAGDEFLLPLAAEQHVNHPSSNLMTMELNEPSRVDEGTASRRPQ
jgi:hypothetical protein